MDKNLIREKNRLLRKTLNQKEASKIILSKIYSMKEFLSAGHVLIFYPLKNEINLLPLLNFKEKKFYLPVVSGAELLICPYSNNLKKSDFNVLEPETLPVKDISIIDIAFVPALAVDKNLNRIGYGKGFYDRLFKSANFRAKKIVVINKELTANKIDPSLYDVKVDLYITD